MTDQRNKHGVQPGQVWKDNDTRVQPERQFEVLSVDLNYYPGGRAECRMLGKVKPGQKSIFWARLGRFNGTKRGYSLTKDAPK